MQLLLVSISITVGFLFLLGTNNEDMGQQVHYRYYLTEVQIFLDNYQVL